MTSRLRLLGTPTLLSDGLPVVFPRRKAMALLAYLAVTGGRHHRESLATMLWPESSGSSAHSALRNLLWLLRTTPISRLLRSDRNVVELVEGDELTVDVTLFRRLTSGCPSRSHLPDAVCPECAPLLGEAVDLWGGAFMSGYVAANSAPFDDWQLTEGEALKRERSDALRRLSEHHRSTGDWARSALYARAWLDTEPLCESASRQLMQALFACGRRSEALRAYDECVQRLRDELDLEPEDATRDLADQVRSTRIASTSTGEKRPNRLPPPPARLLGRRDLADRVERVLLGGSAQAVCLVGLGGVGKTALALHVAQRVENRLAQGAAFVPFDSTNLAVSPTAAIQDALGLSLDGGAHAAPESALAEALRDHEMLLVLDGVEGRLEEVSPLVAALRAAAGVRVLVTSRIEMSEASVVSVPIYGLGCPPDDALPGTLGSYDAVRLLRMEAERHGLVVEASEEERRGMARLARLLEGSPLGLEMAAGWRSVLAWDSIADRVSENLEFLVHRDRGVAPKHRALVALFDHAWSSLAADERIALRRLGVFRGEFTIHAAADIAETNPGALATLVSRCLLMRTGADRYRMHELLRRFAARKLSQESSDATRVQDRYVSYYMDAAARWLEDVKGPDQFSALVRLERELENVRIAFEEAASAGLTDRLREACEGLLIYYTMRTRLVEGESLFSEAMRAYREHDDRDPIVDGFLSVVAGWFASWDRADVAKRRRIDGMALLPEAEPRDPLHAMANAVYAYASLGDEIDRNLERLRGTIAFYEKTGDTWGVAFALEACGAVEARRDGPAAERYIERSIRLRREIGDRWGEGPATFRLASLAESRGDLALALSLYETAQRLNEPYTRNAFGVISAILGRARATRKLGDVGGGRRLAEEALRLSRGSGYRFQIGRSLLELARAAHAEGDVRRAKSHTEEAFDLLASLRGRDVQADCATELVRIALDEGDPGSAERWLREARALQPDRDDLAELDARARRFRCSE
jgi:DNA-binding SARP family transcriptional activator/predicted ATPase